ncbi:RidA family protein [uncultured Nitratireductor sp.]|uniref:RidA family protein n=1 Tax=uncultured Nitratireductor sp. TaxID=520953 RepID=UPI00260F9ED2|nr:RidA family protein [uncultured Nitratireductor sp.]
MMPQNPFNPADSDRFEIWDMLVARDISAFVANDWPAHEKDFLPDGFFGLDGRFSDNPDTWTPKFGDLKSYAEAWQEFAAQCKGRLSPEDLHAAHHATTILRDIDIQGDFAVAHKKFDGNVVYDDGAVDVLNWQTLYFCRKVDGRWWISGFVGFLPNPMGTRNAAPAGPAKLAPPSEQHVTAGPYSPVLEVRPERLFVISGQAALDLDGNVVTQDFREQARVTLDNCLTQLQAAGCSFEDVFKVNVYLTDLNDWPAFNEVYADIMPEPRPARTAVQTELLSTFQVEIDMWAAKR